MIRIRGQWRERDRREAGLDRHSGAPGEPAQAPALERSAKPSRGALHQCLAAAVTFLHGWGEQRKPERPAVQAPVAPEPVAPVAPLPPTSEQAPIASAPRSPARKPKLPYAELRQWWVKEYVPLHTDADKRPSRKQQQDAAAKQFPDHAPPPEPTMVRLRSEKETPDEWRVAGRPPEQEID